MNCQSCELALPTEKTQSITGESLLIYLPCEGCLTHKGEVLIRGNRKAVEEYARGPSRHGFEDLLDPEPMWQTRASGLLGGAV